MPYPEGGKWGGFSQGLLGGIQAVGAIKALKQRQQSLDEENRNNRIVENISALRQASSLVTDPNTPEALKAGYMDVTIKLQNNLNGLLGLDTKLTYDGNFEPEEKKFAKDIENMANSADERGWDINALRKAQAGLLDYWVGQKGKLSKQEFEGIQSRTSGMINQQIADESTLARSQPMTEQAIPKEMENISTIEKLVRSALPMFDTPAQQKMFLDSVGNLRTQRALEVLNLWSNVPETNEKKRKELLDIAMTLDSKKAMEYVKSYQEQSKPQGINAPTKFILEDGEPVYQNTRGNKVDGKRELIYIAGPYESNSLAGLEKLAGRKAVQVAGMDSKDVDSFNGIVQMLNLIDDMESVVDKVSMGIPAAGKAKEILGRYMSAADLNQWNTANDQMNMMFQTIIKGIPSNYDIQLAQKTKPQADFSIAQNKSKLTKMREQAVMALRSKLSNAEKMRLPVPPDYYDAVVKYGANKKSAITDNSKNKGSKRSMRLTKEIASEYIRKHGSKEAGMKAAAKDGYTW